MESQEKAAPGPDFAGWLERDPAPVVMRTDTRHGSVLHRSSVHRAGTELQEPCTKEHEDPAICGSAEARYNQRREALLRANAVRVGRARMKRDTKRGLRKVSALLADPPKLVLGIKVIDLLAWAPNVGRGRARVLARGLVSDSITVADIGVATRGSLIQRVTGIEH